MEQESSGFDLTQFPVCAKKQGKYFYVYYHVMPHPIRFGEVIYKPTGESVNGLNPNNKYEADSQSLRTLRLVLKHQDKAIENFKENLKQLAEAAYEEAQKEPEAEVSDGVGWSAGSHQEPGPGHIPE